MYSHIPYFPLRYDGGPDAEDVPSNLPPSQLQDLIVNFFKSNIMITSDKMKEIQSLTCEQGDNEAASVIWKSERRLRITSSNVKMIAQRRPTTAVAPAVKQMLYSKFQGNAATRYGLGQERESSCKYLEWLQKERGSSGATVNINCGLVVSNANPWLAATPDGWVEDPQASPNQGLVEFKNPYTYRDLLLRDAVDTKKCTCLVNNKGILSLKRSHQYYHQVQFAMYCTNTKWCDFFICAKDTHGERILYDEEFCLSIIPKLKRFYFCAILPELVVQRQPIREPKEWITDEALWMQRVEALTSL